jgi:hypothetical protein
MDADGNANCNSHRLSHSNGYSFTDTVHLPWRTDRDANIDANGDRNACADLLQIHNK